MHQSQTCYTPSSSPSLLYISLDWGHSKFLALNIGIGHKSRGAELSDTDIIHRDSWLTNDIIPLSLHHVQRCVWKIPFMGKRQGTHWQEKAKNSNSLVFLLLLLLDVVRLTMLHFPLWHTHRKKILTFTAHFCFWYPTSVNSDHYRAVLHSLNIVTHITCFYLPLFSKYSWFCALLAGHMTTRPLFTSTCFLRSK